MNIKQLFRTLFKNKTFSILNIVGLSIGVAVVLLICLMVYNERSFDKSFKQADHIYRMNSYLTAYMPGETFCSTSNKTGPVMQEAIPEILTTVRTYPVNSTIRINDNPLVLKTMWADEDFFRLFDTPFIQGSPEAVMKQPNAIAISEQMAKKLFGNENPLGQSFLIDDEHPMEVKAVYRDYPKNSSFYEYQVIAPFNHSFPSWFSKEIYWGNIDFETFCLLSDKADLDLVSKKIEETIKKENEEGFYIPKLQNLKDIHLYSSKYQHSYTSFQSDIGKVKMLTLLAIIILLVACINYMNLSTARAQKRAKEIGINKTLGAKRSNLICKLTFETGIITCISFILAIVMAFLLLPVFNDLLNEELSFSLTFNPVFLLGILLIWIITTLLAASYPALYLSGFPPLLAIRSANISRGSVHALVRKALTVGQFAVAIVLIAWVFVIQSQIRYANNKDIGYNPHNLVGIYVPSNLSETLANEYKALSSVEMVARESALLFKGNGNVLTKNHEDKTGLSLWSIKVDKEFIPTMQLKLIAGENLPQRLPGDTITQIVLNRKAVEYLETTPEEIIGKEVMAQIGEGKTIVCGVVENFNFEPIYKPVTGFCMHNGKNRAYYVTMIRVKDGTLSEQMKTFEQIYKKHVPNDIFMAEFPDVLWEKAYESEHRTNTVVTYFSILAIFIACMGVFGLTAFMAEQRTKEIGIRKVMGANVRDIVSLFTNDYLKLLIISLVLALPVAWWLGNNYLSDFAYRISLSWWMFIVAAMITVLVTILTVCLQAVKAATANPVKSIKTE
ncbi:MAG: ABC transporter permease [Dysgonamonadaceae bacterium]|jgi:ABC-type antimicrobial peptide transport system permease subunit|nr:ABC transporter permease [Dysgonamonadaceae bacterium]